MELNSRNKSLVTTIVFASHMFASAFGFCQSPNLLEKAVSYSAPKHIHELRELILAKNYPRLGRLLKEELGKTITLEEVEQLAQKYKANGLLRAIQATRVLGRDLNEERIRIGLTRGEFFQMALFIERGLESPIQKKQYYLPKSETGFSSSIEYDPLTKKTFILLDGYKNAYIGEGAFKVVTKSLLYTTDHIEVVARGEELTPKLRELEITKLLVGASGVFDIVACTRHTVGSKKYTSIYSRIYSPGALRTAFDEKYKFSLYEKERIALSLLNGLSELHKRKIVHRDLSSRNYLINIPKGKPGRRNIKAAVADLGRAMYAKDAAFTKVQGNTTFTPPEGIFKDKMRGSKYYAADVYALGCVLYQLFYDEDPKWKNSEYVKNTKVPEKIRYKELVEGIDRYTKSRRNELEHKKVSGHISAKEEFEYLILRMVNPDPKKRGSMLQLSQEMQRIVNRGQ